ncbi:MAG TPA: DUF6491 family protein [Rhizomicrobium sp.]
MKKHILFAAGLSLLAAAPAFASPTCLSINQIYNFDAPDNKTLIVEDNSHNKFKVTLFSGCMGLTFKEGLAFKSVGGTGLSCLAAGDAVFTRNMGTGPQRCPIRSVVPYTAEMQKADADAAAAKKAAEQH